MSTDANLTFSINAEVIKKLFSKFASVYGMKWQQRHKTEEQWLETSTVWLKALQEFDISVLRHSIRQALTIHRHNPPTLPELLDLCLSQSGIPLLSEVLRSLPSKNLHHPIIAACYAEIGEEKVNNLTDRQLQIILGEIYPKTLREFRENPEAFWFKYPLLPAPTLTTHPPLVPDNTAEPCAAASAWAQSIDQIATTALVEEYATRQWDPATTNPGSKRFDQKSYDERKFYLINLDETQAMALNASEKFDRIRFLRQAEADHAVLINRSSRITTEPEKTAPRSLKSKVIYKDWMN